MLLRLAYLGMTNAFALLRLLPGVGDHVFSPAEGSAGGGRAGGHIGERGHKSLRQRLVPDRLLGRVNSVYRMIAGRLMPLGSLAGGLTAQRFGLRAPLLGAGAIRFTVLAATLPILLASARGLHGSHASTKDGK